MNTQTANPTTGALATTSAHPERRTRERRMSAEEARRRRKLGQSVGLPWSVPSRRQEASDRRGKGVPVEAQPFVSFHAYVQACDCARQGGAS